MLIIIVLIYFGFSKGFFGNKQKSDRETVVLENPMKNIVMQNTKEDKVNVQAVVKQGVIGFNENYINYLLLAMGVGKLHKAPINFGNPVVEMILDNEVWSSEISDGVLITKKSRK